MGAANMVGGGLNMVGGGLNMVGGGLNEGAAGGVGTSRSPSFCINFAQIFRRAPRAILCYFLPEHGSAYTLPVRQSYPNYC